MLRSRTTTLPAKDLVRCSTSMATAALPLSPLPRLSPLRMALALGGLQPHGDRLADPQVLGLLGSRFNAKHQAGALLAAVDHGWRKLGLGRDEADARDQPRLAAVAANLDAVVDMEAGQRRLRHEEAHLGIVRRQQRDDRPTRLYHFAGAEIDLLYAAHHRACDLAPLEPGAGGVQSRLRRTQRRLRIIEGLLRADGPLEQRLRPLVGLPCIADGSLVLSHRRALQIGVEGKQRRADIDPVAFAHRQAFDTTGLLAADKDQLRLHPTLKLQGRLLAAPKLQGGQGKAEHGETRHGEQALVLYGHGACFPALAVSRSRCAASRPSTSSGSIAANSPSQMTATSSGATISCGKRAAASLENSPRATAWLATARISAMPRATTSR